MISRPVTSAPTKSALLGYILLLVLGGVGGHRIYLNRAGSGLLIAALTFIGMALLEMNAYPLSATFLAGFAILILVFLWITTDAFRIPHWVRES